MHHSETKLIISEDHPFEEMLKTIKKMDAKELNKLSSEIHLHCTNANGTVTPVSYLAYECKDNPVNHKYVEFALSVNKEALSYAIFGYAQAGMKSRVDELIERAQKLNREKHNNAIENILISAVHGYALGQHHESCQETHDFIKKNYPTLNENAIFARVADTTFNGEEGYIQHLLTDLKNTTYLQAALKGFIFGKHVTLSLKYLDIYLNLVAKEKPHILKNEKKDILGKMLFIAAHNNYLPEELMEIINKDFPSEMENFYFPLKITMLGQQGKIDEALHTIKMSDFSNKHAVYVALVSRLLEMGYLKLLKKVIAHCGKYKASVLEAMAENTQELCAQRFVNFLSILKDDETFQRVVEKIFYSLGKNNRFEEVVAVLIYLYQTTGKKKLVELAANSAREGYTGIAKESYTSSIMDEFSVSLLIIIKNLANSNYTRIFKLIEMIASGFNDHLKNVVNNVTVMLGENQRKEDIQQLMIDIQKIDPKILKRILLTYVRGFKKNGVPLPELLNFVKDNYPKHLSYVTAKIEALEIRTKPKITKVTPKEKKEKFSEGTISSMAQKSLENAMKNKENKNYAAALSSLKRAIKHGHPDLEGEKILLEKLIAEQEKPVVASLSHTPAEKLEAIEVRFEPKKIIKETKEEFSKSDKRNLKALNDLFDDLCSRSGTLLALPKELLSIDDVVILENLQKDYVEFDSKLVEKDKISVLLKIQERKKSSLEKIEDKIKRKMDLKEKQEKAALKETAKKIEFKETKEIKSSPIAAPKSELEKDLIALKEYLRYAHRANLDNKIECHKVHHALLWTLGFILDRIKIMPLHPFPAKSARKIRNFIFADDTLFPPESKYKEQTYEIMNMVEELLPHLHQEFSSHGFFSHIRKQNRKIIEYVEKKEKPLLVAALHDLPAPCRADFSDICEKEAKLFEREKSGDPMTIAAGNFIAARQGKITIDPSLRKIGRELRHVDKRP